MSALLNASHLREIRESLKSIESEVFIADGPGEDWLPARLYKIIWEARQIACQLDAAEIDTRKAGKVDDEPGGKPSEFRGMVAATQGRPAES